MTIHYTDLTTAPTHESSPVRIVRHYNPGLYNRFGKRVLDILLVVLAAPLVVPVVLLMAMIVALDGGRPFYSQLRLGRDGQAYRIWKMRTMVNDADARLERYLAANPEARAEWDHSQKLKNDPRITRFGALLRKTSIDELPQLWNVLRGDMSLVGPRPMMLCQRALYPGMDYESMRPGITGPWQVSKRNACGFADRAKFDSFYRENLSFFTDLRLLFATFRVVLRGTGY